MSRFISIAIVLLTLTSQSAFAKQFNVLLFTKTSGWHHESILEGVMAVRQLAQRHHFNVKWVEGSGHFTDDNLKKYDAVIFLSTTGNVLNDEQQQAMERFIQSGKGYVGVHSASDTEYQWPWYQQLVGRAFKIHPHIQTARIHVTDRTFPGLETMPDSMLWTDEWYEFTDENSDKLQYILTVDESTYSPTAKWGKNEGKGMGDFHPIAWYQEFDGGRSFYTAMGHLPAVFSNELFLDHLYGGIYWAATGKGKLSK